MKPRAATVEHQPPPNPPAEPADAGRRERLRPGLTAQLTLIGILLSTPVPAQDTRHLRLLDPPPTRTSHLRLLASRNSAGSYQLPAGNPVVSGTLISSTWANSTLGDLATEMTDSLDRSGKGGMLAQLQLISGTAGAPSWAFSSETNSGVYRAAANDLRFSVAGTDRQQWTQTQVALFNPTGVGALPASTVEFDVPVEVGFTSARFGRPIDTTNIFTTRGGLAFNAYHNGTNWIYQSTGPAGFLTRGTNGGLTLWQAPSGTAGNIATPSVALDANPTGVSVPGTLSIGGGTAISASYRGTVSWTPGSIAAGAALGNTFTVTGAAVGGECAVSIPAWATPINGVTFSCYVAAANSCTIEASNCGACAANTPPAGTYGCRVFNP